MLALGVAGGDSHLGAPRTLALAHATGDVLGQRLRLERLSEDDLVDRLADDLLEARHVRTLLGRVEIDEALELCIEELLVAVRANANHLLDARDADAREADVRGGTARLHVVRRSENRGAFAHADQVQDTD